MYILAMWLVIVLYLAELMGKAQVLYRLLLRFSSQLGENISNNSRFLFQWRSIRDHYPADVPKPNIILDNLLVENSAAVVLVSGDDTI